MELSSLGKAWPMDPYLRGVLCRSAERLAQWMFVPVLVVPRKPKGISVWPLFRNSD